MGPEEIATARWALSVLGPGNRFATDVGSYPVLGSYGDQNPIRDVAYLYTSPALYGSRARGLQPSGCATSGLTGGSSESLPAAGQYFPVDPQAGRYNRPLPAADLNKFISVPGRPHLRLREHRHLRPNGHNMSRSQADLGSPCGGGSRLRRGRGPCPRSR